MPRIRRRNLPRALFRHLVDRVHEREITTAQLGRGEQHYRVLGLTPEASDDEIRAAFRRLATENHPDRVASKSPREIEVAANDFRQIKDAWEELKKLRGL